MWLFSFPPNMPQRRQNVTKWVKIFAAHTTDKGSVSLIYNAMYWINKKKRQLNIKMGTTKDKHLTEEVI